MNIPSLNIPENALGGIITIGNFDGVHRGHQAMLNQLRLACQPSNAPAVVVTFDPHPITVLKPDVRLPRLSSIATRTQLLKQFGANEVVVLPVSTHLLNMTAEQFFNQIVVGQLQADGIVEGPDFRFGKDRGGDTRLLKNLCDAGGRSCKVIDAVIADEAMVSSTTIRQQIQAGQLDQAIQLLGHKYRLTGVVRKGAGRGRTIGFPTANLEDIPELIPANGVYSATTVIDAKQYCVAVNIGPNPTFDDNARKVECHVMDLDADLYDQHLRIDFVSRVRDLCTFPSAEDLIQQIKQDIERCRDACKEFQLD